MKTAAAFLLFFFLVAAAMFREAWGRFRHGNAWEPGDGLGRSEDYENHGGE